jgi:hypothetical protein
MKEYLPDGRVKYTSVVDALETKELKFSGFTVTLRDFAAPIALKLVKSS